MPSLPSPCFPSPPSFCPSVPPPPCSVRVRVRRLGRALPFRVDGSRTRLRLRERRLELAPPLSLSAPDDVTRESQRLSISPPISDGGGGHWRLRRRSRSREPERLRGQAMYKDRRSSAVSPLPFQSCAATLPCHLLPRAVTPLRPALPRFAALLLVPPIGRIPPHHARGDYGLPLPLYRTSPS